MLRRARGRNRVRQPTFDGKDPSIFPERDGDTVMPWAEDAGLMSIEYVSL